MHRFFIPFQLFLNKKNILLPDKVAHHIQVLRIRIGDIITLFDGYGGEYEAILQETYKNHCYVQLIKYKAIERETPYKVILVQALCSNKRMDWLVEKTVELGVNKIIPIFTDRSIIQLKNINRITKRQKHLEQIVISACEQCGRNRIPKVLAPIHLITWLKEQSTDFISIKLMLSPYSNFFFYDLTLTQPYNKTLIILVGPEGGLNNEETYFIKQSGFKSISLGSRILRSETTGIAILAAIASQCKGWDSIS